MKCGAGIKISVCILEIRDLRRDFEKNLRRDAETQKPRRNHETKSSRLAANTNQDKFWRVSFWTQPNGWNNNVNVIPTLE